jgi:hypothetical protein
VTKVNQKEATYNAIINVCGEHDGAYTPTKEERSRVNNILFEGFRSGSIELEREFPDDSDLKAYVSGLQSNWLRKDKRLNGGVSYVAKNPGSRQGTGDASIKAMKALLSTLTSESERAEVQSHIDARVQELQAAKAKVTVDFSMLPADLRAKFSK